jgi:hypothetical protein
MSPHAAGNGADAPLWFMGTPGAHQARRPADERSLRDVRADAPARRRATPALPPVGRDAVRDRGHGRCVDRRIRARGRLAVHVRTTVRARCDDLRPRRDSACLPGRIRHSAHARPQHAGRHRGVRAGPRRAGAMALAAAPAGWPSRLRRASGGSGSRAWGRHARPLPRRWLRRDERRRGSARWSHPARETQERSAAPAHPKNEATAPRGEPPPPCRLPYGVRNTVTVVPEPFEQAPQPIALLWLFTQIWPVVVLTGGP